MALASRALIATVNILSEGNGWHINDSLTIWAHNRWGGSVRGIWGGETGVWGEVWTQTWIGGNSHRSYWLSTSVCLVLLLQLLHCKCCPGFNSSSIFTSTSYIYQSPFPRCGFCLATFSLSTLTPGPIELAMCHSHHLQLTLCHWKQSPRLHIWRVALAALLLLHQWGWRLSWEYCVLSPRTNPTWLVFKLVSDFFDCILEISL